MHGSAAITLKRTPETYETEYHYLAVLHKSPLLKQPAIHVLTDHIDCTFVLEIGSIGT